MNACGGQSKPNTATTIGSQVSTPADPINTYFGTDGDVWNVNIDHTNSQLTAKDVTNGILLVGSAAGTFTTSDGFLDISLSSNGTPPSIAGQEGGFAVDLPGQAALLRLGNPSNPIVPLVATLGCLTINDSLTYQYVTIPTPAWQPGTDIAYGRFQASTSGPNWTISDITQYTLAGAAPANPGAGLPAGYCAQSTLGFAVTAPSVSTNPPVATVTMAFDSSGFFLEDNGSQQGQPQGVVPSNSIGAGVGAIGLTRPSVPVSTSDIVQARYVGFLYEPIAAPLTTSQVTQLVSFGCMGPSCPAPVSPTSMAGGAFPNEDLTQPPTQDLLINLGPQDPQNNGRYSKAEITIAGVLFPAVAVVGDPAGKFAILLVAYDNLNNIPVSIYLFQQ